MVLAPAGDATLTFAAQHAGVPVTLLAAGALVTATALAALPTPIRRGGLPLPDVEPG